MQASATRVGWLGTGRMGAAMAGRLIDAGDQVTVWNRTKSKAESLARHGAEVAGQISDLGRCDIVFVTVAGSGDLEQVVTGDHGLLAADPRPAVIVDCSTVSAEASARVRAAAEEAGVEFLAAPVSGNPHVVAAGAACIVASGPAPTFRRAQPYLERIARTVVHAGADEQARLVKLCHNLYLGMLVQALVEVTALAEKGGTDRAAFLAFLNSTGLGSDWTRRRSADLISRDWTPTFTTELLRKDFDLGLGAARTLDVPMPVASAVSQLIQSAINTGLADIDFLALYEQQARASGLPSGAGGNAG
jgi:3-hydroxyisobutyrate dehydrogenase-like beta-hydroxyacid dehydrogenase